MIIASRLFKYLKQAKDLKSTVLKKMTLFVLGVVIVSLLLIITISLQNTLNTYSLVFQTIFRILEVSVCEMIIVLLRDTRGGLLLSILTDVVVSKEVISDSKRPTSQASSELEMSLHSRSKD